MAKAVNAFKTISEVADSLNLPAHVLRFWESKFKQIQPLKRGGGRRYYRPEDVALITRIQQLLHTQGYTIRGVQQLLAKEGRNKAGAQAPETNLETRLETTPAVILADQVADITAYSNARKTLFALRTELINLRALLQQAC